MRKKQADTNKEILVLINSIPLKLYYLHGVPGKAITSMTENNKAFIEYLLTFPSRESMGYFMAVSIKKYCKFMLDSSPKPSKELDLSYFNEWLRQTIDICSDAFSETNKGCYKRAKEWCEKYLSKPVKNNQNSKKLPTSFKEIFIESEYQKYLNPLCTMEKPLLTQIGNKYRFIRGKGAICEFFYKRLKSYMHPTIGQNEISNVLKHEVENFGALPTRKTYQEGGNIYDLELKDIIIG